MSGSQPTGDWHSGTRALGSPPVRICERWRTNRCREQRQVDLDELGTRAARSAGGNAVRWLLSLC